MYASLGLSELITVTAVVAAVATDDYDGDWKHINDVNKNDKTMFQLNPCNCILTCLVHSFRRVPGR